MEQKPQQLNDSTTLESKLSTTSVQKPGFFIRVGQSVMPYLLAGAALVCGAEKANAQDGPGSETPSPAEVSWNWDNAGGDRDVNKPLDLNVGSSFNKDTSFAYLDTDLKFRNIGNSIVGIDAEIEGLLNYDMNGNDFEDAFSARALLGPSFRIGDIADGFTITPLFGYQHNTLGFGRTDFDASRDEFTIGARLGDNRGRLNIGAFYNFGDEGHAMVDGSLLVPLGDFNLKFAGFADSNFQDKYSWAAGFEPEWVITRNGSSKELSLYGMAHLLQSSIHDHELFYRGGLGLSYQIPETPLIISGYGGYDSQYDGAFGGLSIGFSFGGRSNSNYSAMPLWGRVREFPAGQGPAQGGGVGGGDDFEDPGF